MTITSNKRDSELTVMLDGRLDTNTSPKLETELKHSINDVTSLIFDLTKLAYISSAGLRVLLSAQKVMNKQGSMKVTGANEAIMEIFEVTGFVDILDIEA